MKYLFFFLALVSLQSMGAQNAEFDRALYKAYSEFEEPSIQKRRIHHSDIQPLIAELRNDSKYTVKKVGSSIEGRDLHLISLGSGATNVFLWSQMHGDEPTATQAIFDIFNFFDSDQFSEEKEKMLSELTLHFLPMLNPDGAEVFQRRNRLGVDINRDALRLQSPESRTLKRVRDSLDADVGFNLHDQSRYYNTPLSEKPATISYLAPAYNYEKDINDVRGRAMKLIVMMNNSIQKFAPGQVGRYDDAFEPRAFGDNIQKWGTSTILIESGGYPGDVEKQEIRKLNFMSVLMACHAIATKSYESVSIEDYEQIPPNDRKLYDLKLVGLNYKLLGETYKIDLGIHHLEIDNDSHSDFYNKGQIVDMGDLSTFYGYETLDADGYTIVEGKTYPDVLGTLKDVSKLKPVELLKSGYLYVKLKNLPDGIDDVKLPINILSEGRRQPGLYVGIGGNPNFLLEKEGKFHFAVVNGFLIDLSQNTADIPNAMIYKN